MIAEKTKKSTLVRHELKVRLLRVVRVTQLTPRMVRVTLAGAQLEGFVTLSPDDHVKLLFPVAGQEKPTLPTPGPNGMEWPEGEPRPAPRDFTPRRYDPISGELDIDFLLHEEGIATQWASQAQIGQYLGVAGPRGSHVASYESDWYLLVGDESALPSIARRLEELPADSRAFVFIEVNDASDRLPLESPANASICWVYRENGPEQGSALETAVRGLKFPEGEYQAWISGEVSGVRAIFRYLLDEKGASREQVKADGYWKRGTVNHDHHEPIEA